MILNSIADIQAYIFAEQELVEKGQPEQHAIFTIHNEKNDHHFTYKFVQAQKPKKDVYWVYVLVMPDNQNKKSYKFLGAASLKDGYKWSQKAQIHEDSPSNKALVWLFKSLGSDEARNEYPEVKFYKASKCSNCGHLLTVPLSIQRGMGDCCFEKTNDRGNYIDKQSYNNKTGQLKIDWLE